MVTMAEIPPVKIPNDFTLDRVELEVWWMASTQRRSFHLEGYRRRRITKEDLDESRPK